MSEKKSEVFEDVITSEYRPVAVGRVDGPAPPELLLLFGEAAGMHEARWGNLVSPSGEVFRNFSRCSRPGFSPRFGSGKTAAPRPAAHGLEVCRELDGWLLELVFDEERLTYQELSRRLGGVLEVLRA